MSPLLRTFWLGAGLIVLTNAVVLGGVAYNRSGEPQSRLQLSERELSRDISLLQDDSENSSLVLRLDHEVADGWVTAEKLRSLGFTVWRDGELERFGERMEVEGLVVLELDGPAYQAAQVAARTALVDAQQAEQLWKDRNSQEALKAAQNTLERLQTKGTRLYVVDAGTDAVALRQRYPDPARYALVRTSLWYYVHYSSLSDERNGYGLQVDRLAVSVPNQHRAAFDAWLSRGSDKVRDKRVRVDLAFGQRFEPWIVAAERPE